MSRLPVVESVDNLTDAQIYGESLARTCLRDLKCGHRYPALAEGLRIAGELLYTAPTGSVAHAVYEDGLRWLDLLEKEERQTTALAQLSEAVTQINTAETLEALQAAMEAVKAAARRIAQE